ncbi:peptidoglycan-binding domain-containing protein [Granulosicoccus sp. 3-233]|uniref:peptidoglycan-binding domain-containing protein n=1 Tax=Granulosicoccus sp. 3-233 TaxID=3417969 RepID=UPI003D329E44
MARKFPLIGKQAGQFVLVATMTGVLAACGGSSSGDGDGSEVPLGEQDFDNDGFINDEDDDADGDGIIDLDDEFVDLDGDGRDDLTLLTEAELEGDTGNEGEFVEVSADNPCGSESGEDNSSVNAAWNDNCLVERSLTGGQFADSLFSVGIQRVLYCSGFGNASSYIAFADGEYGELSEAAAIEFQNAESLTPDGVVGRETWGRLQTRLELLAIAGADETRDTYGFTSGRCAGIPLFYQEFVNSEAGGWTLARNQPNEAEEIPFSYELPFGRL